MSSSPVRVVDDLDKIKRKLNDNSRPEEDNSKMIGDRTVHVKITSTLNGSTTSYDPQFYVTQREL